MTNELKVTRTLNARIADKDNVELELTVTNVSTKLDDGLESIIREAGIKSICLPWLNKYHSEETANWSGEMTLADIVEWYQETAGTRGSSKQDFEQAQIKVTELEQKITALAVALAGGKIKADKFQDQMSVLSETLETARADRDEKKATYEADKKKRAEARAANADK